MAGTAATTRSVLLRLDDLALPPRYVTVPSHLPVSDLLRSLPLPSSSSSSFYLTSDGRPLPASSPVASLPPSASVQLRLRALRGGGGDGGATGAESRDCYLSMYLAKKPDKADPNETRLSRFTCCALSGEPLAAPTVADCLGSLYNKEPLVEALLYKRLPKALSHIRGLKDMIPIHLHPRPDADADAAGAEVRFQCPITGLEFNGKYQFLALRGCGHVLSMKALKEVKTTACLVCHKEFDEADKMPINGTEEDVTVLRQRMEEARGKVKEKKEKKVGNGLSGSKHAAAVASGVEKLENGKKGEAAPGKRFKAGDHAPAHANKEVYASIFTSSKKSDFKETYSCRSLPIGRN